MVNKHSGTPGRCVWDGTGCYDDGCNPDQRQTNCGKFEQEDACKSDTGADNRCTWSAIAEVAAEVVEQIQADASGLCVWDGTGCYDDGCKPDQRRENCAKFEQEESCKSEKGADNRCTWSAAGSQSSLFGMIEMDFGLPNPKEMSWDLMVVAIALFVFMAWIGYNLVRCCQRPKKFEYEPIYETEMSVV